jgi:hypothetical protein
MWIPTTEAEIRSAIDNGILVETAWFDAKQELPARGRNKDLAKDICAMTIEGGVLLYGIGGDDPTRPDQLMPFDRTGASERIDQVAQTGIREPPTIEIHDIDSLEQPGLGYLCVAVPASPRSPHMLTIDSDNRYWGRGAASNRILPEGEISRLYERRERWDVDRDQLLNAAVLTMPFGFDLAEHGVILVMVRPVVPLRELLRVAAGSQPIDDFIQQHLTAAAREVDPYPDQGTSGFDEAFQVSRAGAEQWISSRDADLSFPYQARVELTADGGISYWHAPIISTGPQHQAIMERSVTRAVCQALGAGAFLHTCAGFHGSIDVAVAVLGIETVGGATLISAFGGPPAYGAPDYRRHARVSSAELRDHEALTRRLLAPLFEVISVRGFDPLAERTDQRGRVR